MKTGSASGKYESRSERSGCAEEKASGKRTSVRERRRAAENGCSGCSSSSSERGEEDRPRKGRRRQKQRSYSLTAGERVSVSVRAGGKCARSHSFSNPPGMSRHYKHSTCWFSDPNEVFIKGGSVRYDFRQHHPRENDHKESGPEIHPKPPEEYFQEEKKTMTTGTQTSPLVSPSTSFQWLPGTYQRVSDQDSSTVGSESDSSSLVAVSTSEDEDEGRGKSSSSESISRCLDSLGPCCMEEESGIGTTSPRTPRHHRSDSNSSTPSMESSDDQQNRRSRGKRQKRSTKRQRSSKITDGARARVEVRARSPPKGFGQAFPPPPLPPSPSCPVTPRGDSPTPVMRATTSETHLLEKPPLHNNDRSFTQSESHLHGTRLRVKRLTLNRLGDLSSSSTSTLETPIEERVPPLPPSRKYSHPVTKPHVAVRKLPCKSSSAPVLERITKKVAVGAETRNFLRHYIEVEAAEACRWLRAAGFPQYAQMYEEVQFPLELKSAEKDHPFLDSDALEALYRRLEVLNRCAKMKIDYSAKPQEESDEEDGGRALSGNWKYERESHRWTHDPPLSLPLSPSQSQGQGHIQVIQGRRQESSPSSPSPSLAALISPTPTRRLHASYRPFPNANGSLESMVSSDSSPRSIRGNHEGLPPSPTHHFQPPPFRRSSSERFKDSARALIRRMDSFTTRKRKQEYRNMRVISGPKVIDFEVMEERMRQLNCVDISPSDWLASHQSGSGIGELGAWPVNGVNQSGESSQAKGALRLARDSSPVLARKPVVYAKKSSSPQLLSSPQLVRGCQESQGPVKPVIRASSFNSGRDSQALRDKLALNFMKGSRSGHGTPMASPVEEDRQSIYDNIPIVILSRGSSPAKDMNGPQEDQSGSSEATLNSSCGSMPLSQSPSCEDIRNGASVVRWHSFQRGSLSSPFSLPPDTVSIQSLAVGQFLVLRKAALLRLTAILEKHSSSFHNSGFSWDWPKLIRKIRPPDYKDKSVFGVPLHVVMQQTGYALPPAILRALDFLRKASVDAVGIFRKPGVRSRIEKLKLLCEAEGEAINFDGQQPYDVADLVKQYFRDLPEPLLTNKLSETFLDIFQYVPEDLRGDATRCCLLLMPDENREALFTLLTFLDQVAYMSSSNQMTSGNLAVCLAPSLFRLGTSQRGGSPSPRRMPTKQPVIPGIPDHRDLCQQKAAHHCLAFLIKESHQIFSVPPSLLSQCEFSYMDLSQPVNLQSLGQDMKGNWESYMDACISGLLKEVKDGYAMSKYARWVNVSTGVNGVEVSYKKVGDDHPLRLWKVTTDITAPPEVIMERILRHRGLWDPHIFKWKNVAVLAHNADVFHYVSASMEPHPLRDFLVLRYWKKELGPKNSYAIVETSVEHYNALSLNGSVRGVVLASRFLIEPCGSGKTRVSHLSRIEIKGRSVEWYQKSYGHTVGLQLARLRDSFLLSVDGPESKV